MANTPNLNLVKPASTDNYDVAVQNGNMDIVDAAVKALQDGTTAAQVLTKILSVDGAGSGLDADKLDGQEGSYYRNADQVDGLHFRLNGGVLEYSTDGGSWSPVGLICTKPRQANLVASGVTINTPQTICNVTGKGQVNRIVVWVSGTNNSSIVITVTVDGVVYVIDIAGISSSAGDGDSSMLRYEGPLTFLESLVVTTHHTYSGTVTIAGTVDYAVV